MFVKGTQVFTNTGFKNIEDISGNDKVLVRNFLGDAELIQPFALKKRQYDGEIVKIGGQRWSFSVTPEHVVVYDRDDTPTGAHFTYTPAGEMTLYRHNRIYRKFKYMPPEDYKREKISINDEFGKRWSTISNQDWFVLVGYVLCRGKIEKQSSRLCLSIYIDEDKRDTEIPLLGDILDRIGVQWSLLKSDREFIRVSVKNSLASRVANNLGRVRKEMVLPDKMIYNSSKELTSLLIETIISASIRKDTKRGSDYSLTSTNKELLDSLVVLGTLWGYGMTIKLQAVAGTQTKMAKITRNQYSVTISKPTMTYAPSFIKKEQYSGKVYGIDLFDGQVYVREKGMPVWVNPK